MCIVGQHKKHEFQELIQVAPKLKSQLETALSQTKSAKEEAIKIVSKMEKRINEIKLQQTEGTTEIKKIFSEARAKLTERESTLISELMTLSTEQTKPLQSQLDSAKKVISSAEHQCQVAAT